MSGKTIALGKFELVEVLQVHDGFAVALCHDPHHGAQVICKTAAATEPDDQQLAALRREYELVQKAQGEGVVKLMGLERSETGAPILVFERFQGGRLDWGDAPMTAREYLPYFIMIAKTLGHIHARKIIHRDLTPDNILWNRKTQATLIIDFHLATDIVSETVKPDAVESLCGTLPFISPEQTGRMNRKVDFRSDFYSLGMTFYHLLAGGSPFQARDAMGWVYCHITEKAPLLSDAHQHVPLALAKVIDKLLAKNAEDRYQSSFGLVRDLEIILENLDRIRSEDFEPGRFDVSERLTIPEKLYGRETELASFLACFEHVRVGEKFMCTIAGSSGMGKSVLVNEVNKPVIAARGNFIAGKCDQYKRNMPYSAIKPAFVDLIRQYLAKPAEEVELLSRSIMTEIGANAQVIAEIVPELEVITGPLKPVSKLPPAEARIRFQKAFEDLMRIFTAGGHPLVVFLDDLQWSDVPSLKLMEYLMLEAELTNFMIIAVFRDNEVEGGHPLLMTLDAIRKKYELPAITLSPLSKTSIAALLGDTFRCPVTEVMDLADILYKKTAGNPFHITEMIKSLHESGAITFDTDSGEWRWSVQKISEAGISNDVIELMLGTLQKCSIEAQDRLKFAACVGAQFELSVLASVTQTPEYKILEDLWPTIEKGLIIPLGETYKLLKNGMNPADKTFYFKFQHDRVHEAAYLLIEASQRPITHLHIGRLLHRRYQGKDLENQVTEVVRHYNLAIDIITDPAEMLEACQLNLMAAIKSRNSVAYESSLQHLKIARSQLPAQPWTDHYALTLKVHMNLSEVAFLVGDLDLVERTNVELLQHVKDLFDRAEIHSMRIEQKFSLGLTVEARQIGIASLQALGLNFPNKPNKFDVLKHVFAMKRRLKKVDLDHILEGKRLNDRRVQLILKQIVALNPVFFSMADRPASALSIFENLRLSLEHGICPESAYGFAGTGSLLGNLLGMLEVGNKLGKVALDITELFAVPSMKTAIYHIYTSFIAPFNIDMEHIGEYVSMTLEAGLAVGDLYFLPVAAAMSQIYALHMPLSEMIEKDESFFLHLTRKSNNLKCHETLTFLNRYRHILLEKPSEAEMDRIQEANQHSVKIFDKEKFLVGSFVYDTYNAFLQLMVGDCKVAYQHTLGAWKIFLTSRGTFHETEYHYVHAMVTSQVWGQLSARERKEARRRLKFGLKRMKVLAAHHPGNFLYKYLVMQAEDLAIRGRLLASIECLERAVEAVNRGYFRDVGLINEICASRYLQLGKKRLANTYIRDAYGAFKAWQAEHKVIMLLKQWPVLQQEFVATPKTATQSQSMRSQHQESTGADRGKTNQSLDMLTITRASQTLSGQVEMEGLVQHLMKIIIENAGAHYGVLMLNDRSRNQTRVIARILSDRTTLVKDQSLGECGDLSLAIMLYTSRMNETVIVDDVDRDERYRNDPYIQRIRPKSILAMPITIKGQAIGYFYLENHLIAGSFTRDRVEILNILGTQAAISLENAQLYANLEQKVRERTAQLAEKNRDIRSILANIKQGILTITPGLRVDGAYSLHLETLLHTRAIADRDAMELIFAGADVASDVLDQIRSCLYFSIREDLLNFRSNEALLIREFVVQPPDGEKQFMEIDWEPIVSPEGLVEKIMVTIRDVTEVKRLTAVSEQSRRELSMLSQILNAGSEHYRGFMNNAHRLLTKAWDLMRSAKAEDQEAINVAYRHLHTMKGNARLLSLTDLTSLVHDCESILMQLKMHGVPFESARDEVLAFIERIHLALQEYERVYTEKLLGYTVSGHSQQGRRLMTRLEEKMRHWEVVHPEICKELLDIISHANQQTLAEILQPLQANTEALALGMDKAAPTFHLTGEDMLLSDGEASLLTNAFVHLLSNAVNHGLETAAQRIEHGKSAAGKIFIIAEEQEYQRCFTIYDDGRGLNLEAIRKRAIARQIISEPDQLNDQQLAMMIFHSGFSTAESVSQSAGRGVGMDAILDMVREAGGRLELQLDAKSPFERKAFRIRINLPKAQLRQQVA